MRLVRAEIDGFGRYIGRTFDFGRGLNVVYGKNEAGKSTLQQFVLAMLYGMKKPGRKRAVYLEEEAKYRPWHGGIYGGKLWVEVDGVLYRIERNLRREDEWVRIFRDDTGEDLTSRFPLDSRKELSFAQVLWQADRELFTNTCCIGPIDERERAGWLLESARQGDTNQEVLATPDQMKIRIAEEALQKRLEMIGSERATTRPFAQRIKKRDDLKRLYQEARDREESQKGARVSAEELTRDYQDAVRDEQVLRGELSTKLARYLNVQEAKIGERRVRLDQLEQTLSSAKKTVSNALDEGVFQEMQQDFQRLLSAKTQVDSYQKRLTVLREESGEAQLLVEQYPTIDEGSLIEVERIASRLELVESQTQAQGTTPDENGSDLLAELEKERQSQRKKLWIAATATVLCAPFGLLQWWLSILVIAWLAVGIHYYFQMSKVDQSIKRVREERVKQAEVQTASQDEQAALEAKLLEMLAAFEVDTPRQYRQKWSGLIKAREQVALYVKQVVWLNAELARAQGERDILARKLLRHLGGEDRPASQLDTEQLREEIARWEARFEEFRHLRTKMGGWERDRERLLYELEAEEKELDRWQEIARALNIKPEPPSLFAPSPITSGEVERFYDSWREAERMLLERKSLYAEANTRYKTLREGAKPASEILLEWERAEEELNKLTLEREALLIANEVFSEVKEELYRAAAPRFAAALSAVTERVTAGRYQEVYLDGEKTISTISPDSGYTVDLGVLSSGTIDQITFALGLSISGISIPGGERLPLLFDEPFRRYDDERLNAVLDLLLEEAQQRQILLFTCREQEAERILERQDTSVTLVELSEASMVK